MLNTHELKHTNGMIQLSAHGMDEIALLHVLHIIHLQNDKVPRAVGLEMLAKIAVIADFFHCKLAIQVFADMWCEGIEPLGLPAKVGRELMLHVFVASCFDRKQWFEEATRLAILNSPFEEIPTFGLPLQGIDGKLLHG